MGMFDSLWDRASAVLDTSVDAVVGDRLRYRHNGVWLGSGDPAVVEGFVLFELAADGMDELDSRFSSRPRVKIAKALVDEPIRTDRIQHPKLGTGWFQPGGNAPATDGRYWLFDVQACPAP